MNSVIVYAGEEKLVQAFAAAAGGAKINALPGGISIESELGSAIIRTDSDIHEQLDENERQCIEGIVGTPFDCYSISFRDFSVVERILQALVDRQVAIDNDHGIILPIQSFLELIQRAPWDSSPDDKNGRCK